MYLVEGERKSRGHEMRNSLGDEGEYDKIIDNIMIFDIAHTIGIDIDREIHLLGSVHRLIANLNANGSLHNWEFRLTLEGKKYWYNTVK